MKESKLLGLPSFALGVFLLYWSLPLGVLLGKIQYWKYWGKRDDAFGWGLALKQLFGIRMLTLPGPRLYTGRCFYLANHRSWGDFFIDVLTTEGHAQMLSRMAVAYVFPFFMVAVDNIGSVILFRRGGKMDRDKFMAFIDRKLASSPVPSLIVYPEGHRSLRPTSLLLKKGMLHYLYSRKMPAQIVMTVNKEAVLSEKQLSAHFGQTILVAYSEPLSPEGHDSPESFFAAIQREWDAQWQRAYSADLTDGRLAPISTPVENRDYPRRMKFWSIILTSGSCLAFFVTLYGSGLALLIALHHLGRLKVPVLAALLTWCAASLVHSLRPVRFPERRLLSAAGGSEQQLAAGLKQRRTDSSNGPSS